MGGSESLRCGGGGAVDCSLLSASGDGLRREERLRDMLLYCGIALGHKWRRIYGIRLNDGPDDEAKGREGKRREGEKEDKREELSFMRRAFCARRRWDRRARMARALRCNGFPTSGSSEPRSLSILQQVLFHRAPCSHADAVSHRAS